MEGKNVVECGQEATDIGLAMPKDLIVNIKSCHSITPVQLHDSV